MESDSTRTSSSSLSENTWNFKSSTPSSALRRNQRAEVLPLPLSPTVRRGGRGKQYRATLERESDVKGRGAVGDRNESENKDYASPPFSTVILPVQWIRYSFAARHREQGGKDERRGGGGVTAERQKNGRKEGEGKEGRIDGSCGTNIGRIGLQNCSDIENGYGGGGVRHRAF